MIGMLLVLASMSSPVRAHVFAVSNTNDSGPGSLRQAIIDANDRPGPDTIAFDIADCPGVCTIQALSALPSLTGGGTTIDGYTQPSALPATEATTATLMIEIDGSSAGEGNGLTIGSSGNVIKGLVIDRFSWNGVSIGQSTGNTLCGNYIGTDATGTADLGNAMTGVSIGYAHNNTIGGDAPAERNVISGNDRQGVSIAGDDATGNVVAGNYIGTDAAGVADLGNASDGIYIGDGAQGNTVGGDESGEGNVISGNDSYGVLLKGNGTSGNSVSGNRIGVDASGTIDLGNASVGVYIHYGPKNNTIGGDAPGAGNVISGNDSDGISLAGTGTTSNTISGNYIGTDKTGTQPLGNAGDGVDIGGGAADNTVGGEVPGERNVISGNLYNGVLVRDSATTGNRVSGNYIGTNATATAAIRNMYSGVSIGNGAQHNTVGGDTPGERNVVSGNQIDGVFIYGAGTMSNTVSGNYIGTDASGTADLGNASIGASVQGGASLNTIGGDSPGERNTISGNLLGVYVGGTSTTSNTVSGNYVGTDASGTADLGNTGAGVSIKDGASWNTIGGLAHGEGNVISGNDEHGVQMWGTGIMGNKVLGNYIGGDAAGMAQLGNEWCGVYLGGGVQESRVGPDNTIAHNSGHGVFAEGSSTIGNRLTQNRIYANAWGVRLWADANGGIAPPTIDAATLGSVSVVGTACPGCTVELFENADDDGEGETYVGEGVAAASGAFTVTVASIGKPYLTATATHPLSGTSEFSGPFAALFSRLWLPMTFGDH